MKVKVMSKAKCKAIRAEIEEVMLGDDVGADALAHLSECHECREFHEKQTKLRQIVGSLGTVAAPPDFDFRLRSRLARENSAPGLQLNRSAWSLGQRGLAATMALALLFGAVMAVRYFSNREPQVQTASQQPEKPAPAPTAAPQEEIAKTVAPDIDVSGLSRPINASEKPGRSGSRDIKKQLSTVDSASTRASLVRFDQSSETDEGFPVDAAQQSLKVSLFDSRGNPRTVSVPTVSFGSKRVLPVGSQFAPKGSW